MSSSAARFFANDVLYGRMRPYLNKVISPPFDGLASAEFIVFPITKGIDSKFLLWRLSSNDFVEFACSQYEGDRPRVKFDQLGKFELRLPPTAEQTRIVEKLEELFSVLDAGVAELKAAQKKLAQYRQSLLKSAVDGSLTAQWRAEAKVSAGETANETGAQLLERILRERRARWEAKQLAKFKEQGKTPPKGWQDKYPEPVQPDTGELPALPEGWVWACLDQLALMVRNGLPQKPSTEPLGYPILRINAVRSMSVNMDEVRYLDIKEHQAADYFLEEGDLLTTRYNGSVDLLGVVGLVRRMRVPTLHPDKLIRIKPVIANTLGEWIEICAATGVSRTHVVSRVKTTAGQTGISGEDIKKMPIPLAPLSEQSTANEKLAVALLGVANQSSAIEMSLAQADAQRKNILRAAFSGQLVPQDPNDEPASVLLERIKAERDSGQTGTISRRKPRPHGARAVCKLPASGRTAAGGRLGE
jgi:type I restriction enzyme S subunit